MSRSEWLAGGFEALREGGFETLRVEPLATRLGVTKGSFYHHFDNRRALHIAMLDAWEAIGTSDIIVEVDQATDDPGERLRTLAHRTIAGSPEGDSIENAVRAWAATDPIAAAAAERVDERRIAYVADLLRTIGLAAPLARRRARLFYRVLIGEFLWRSAGGPTMSKREVDEAVDLLVMPG